MAFQRALKTTAQHSWRNYSNSLQKKTTGLGSVWRMAKMNDINSNNKIVNLVIYGYLWLSMVIYGVFVPTCSVSADYDSR